MITSKAFAKINLSLDIVGKKSNGYHLIDSIILYISLFDTVTIEKSNKFSCNCNDINLPQNEDNIALKAAKLFFNKTNIDGFVSINIDKKIPSCAGLGGGSADAAVVLKSLNELYGTGLNLSQLSQIGTLIGCDIPPAIYGGTVLVGGVGDNVTPLGGFFDLPILICSPNFKMSTKTAFELIDHIQIKNHPNTSYLIDAFKRKKQNSFLSGLINVFEEIYHSDEVDEIKKTMINCGAYTSLLTGSGSCVFGIFSNLNDANTCMDKLKYKKYKTYLTFKA